MGCDWISCDNCDCIIHYYDRDLKPKCKHALCDDCIEDEKCRLCKYGYFDYARAWEFIEKIYTTDKKLFKKILKECEE